jgi:hypothetical protein
MNIGRFRPGPKKISGFQLKDGGIVLILDGLVDVVAEVPSSYIKPRR